MKKQFLSPLLILLAAFCLLSCSNQLRTKTDVTFNFPLNEIRNSLTARGIWLEEDPEYLFSVDLEVKLFVNDKLYDSPRTVKIEEENDIEFQPVTFKNIALNSTVYAEAWIKITITYEGNNYTYTVMYGKSETTVLDSDSKNLPVILKWYNDEGRFVPPEPTPIILISKIQYQFYTQKDETTDYDNVENYELSNTISIDITPTNASNYYEYLKGNEILMQIMDVQFDMEVGGFEEYDALSAEKPQIEDKTIIVKSYWVKTGTGITPQIFDSVTSNEEDSYKLYFYDDRYVIKNAADQKLAYGTFYTVSANSGYKFIFCQERAYDEGKVVFLYTLGSVPNNYETCNYNADNATIVLNCIDSSRNTIPITFEIPGTIDLSAYAYSNLSGNIVYAGIPKVTITKDSSTQMPNLVSGSVSFTATLQNQEENPDLNMTVELYFLGNKVDPSSYKAEYDGSNKKLTVSPIALSSGGTYVVKVIAMSTSSGTAYTVSNNFIIEIDGYIRKTLDVSDPYFINDLMEFIPIISGPAEITLTGTKNLPGSEYALEDSLYYQMSTVLSTATQPVTIDMTNVSGTAVKIFDTTGYTNTAGISIKLPSSVNRIYYREGTFVDVSESSGRSGTDQWDKLGIPRNNSSQELKQIINSILNGTGAVSSSVINELVGTYSGNHQQYPWTDLCEVVSTGQCAQYPDDVVPGYDYLFVKK